MDDKLHSVKVFVLVEDEQWKIIGTGQISSKYIERLQGVCLLVHSESDGSQIMECKIYPNVPYHKQRGEIIVWSEAKNHGMAIYFQEPSGCQEIWEDICQVQGKDPSVEITQEVTDDLETFADLLPIGNLFEMPNCELNTLEHIADLFTFVDKTPNHRERMAMVLEKGSYIKKLLQLFNTCEKLKNMEALHFLNNIIKGILFLDDTRLLNIMFSDEFFMDVVGCLEYDPALDQPKQYREFLLQNAKFREIMPITNSQLRQKIQETYRMQYVYDIVLPAPSIFDSNLLSDLNAMIIFNKSEIITMLQDDENFLLEALSQLKDNTVGYERWYELLLFFKEFCIFAKALENQEKDELLKTLIKLGIMSALKVLVHMHDYQIQKAALDIFPYLVEYNPCLVREYLLEEAQDSEDNDELLINVMIKQMIYDPDPEFSKDIILPAVLRALLDPENMHVTANGCEKAKFLNFFYARCMGNLIAPILSTTVENDTDDNMVNICPNYQNAQLLGVILEILTFCVQYHSTYMKNYILNNNLLSRILMLMSSKHTFLILCAVRFMRKIISLKDEIYNLYIIKKNLFEPIVNAFMHNGTRYNMLNSAIIELFEFIRQENIKSLIANIVENFFIAFESIEYVQTFKGLKTKYEEEKKRESGIRRNLYNVIYQKIYCRHIKVMELKVKADICCREITEEEGAILPMGKEFPSHYDIIMKIKETNENENVIEHPKSNETSKCSSSCGDASSNKMSMVHCSSLVPLVDYPYDTDGESDDDPYGNDENDDEDKDNEPLSKRPNLSS
ncbi:rCG36340 [Rattus norvegicus]|uniref:Protein phosphatase 4 regulatory subunit 3C like 2 n=2 Tax=Rattus norvegicus TaxID=10116 RepID=A0A8I5ZY13_RAT|nr:protein PPP4R3C [Rattus norvegicus]XP_017457795.1 protein PPP4R3C [Rattus norvegicus]XP_038956217.1 protein PPP4R3C [Rattus norvegicus]EDL96033.1 rCG36340 [Rattus norvegicus]|eukprot:XP_006257065.1 PREDICTED: putative SMEK homolog 3 [Rattus norvegicus]